MFCYGVLLVIKVLMNFFIVLFYILRNNMSSRNEWKPLSEVMINRGVNEKPSQSEILSD